MKRKFILYSLSLMILTSTAYAQVKIGSNPGTISVNSNLEVEATNGNKTSVNKNTGQVTIQDGTQGAAKILTSDANGGASWQTLNQQNIPVVVAIGEQKDALILTPAIVSQPNQQKDRIPLSIRTGSLPGYNTTTKEYTIQESAYYRIYAGALFNGTQAGTGTSVRLYLQPFGVLQQYDDITTNTFPVVSLFWEGYLNAGTVINPFGFVFASPVTNSNGAIPLQNVYVGNAFMSVTKLF